jgi:hypothetical protein
VGGATLEDMWLGSRAPDVIGRGIADVVVLQGDIPETDVDTFQQYARLFIQHVRDSGAEPVLYMTWPYQRLGWIGLDEIAQAHAELQAETGVTVAPVGEAWRAATQARSQLDLFVWDQEHPNIRGTYLAASVIYGTLTETSPQGLSYRPRGLHPLAMDFLQDIAWQAQWPETMP